MDLRIKRIQELKAPTLILKQDATGEGLARRLVEGLYGWRHRLATAAVCLLALWFGFRVISGPNGWVVYHQKKVEYRRLQQEVDKLQKQNDDLDRRIKALKSDPEAIEREAREQFRYARPGEIVYVLPEQKPAVVQPPSSGLAQKSKP